MARVIKVLRTLRNNWKKSTFVAILGYYGEEYARDWHRDYLMMREYSKEALVYGLRPLPSGARNKHVTVFLNPVSSNRKSKAKLEKYAEPLLHLSGFLVNTVRTERIDEARDLAGVIEKTNILAAAGGDGTVFEVVTGLLRRADADEAIMRYPVGVLPLGYHNQFANRLIQGGSKMTEAQFIAESAMAIVKHKIKPQDVMEVQIADEGLNEPDDDTESSGAAKQRKPFYSLAGISIGQFREAQKIKDDMPGIFPNYFTTFWSLYRTPQQYFRGEIKYIPSCEGCMNCKTKLSESSQMSVNSASSEKKDQGPSIWSRLISIFRPQPVHAQERTSDEDYINPDCGNWVNLCVDTSECNVTVGGNGKLRMEVNQKLSKTDFMIEGLKRYGSDERHYSSVIECQAVEIIPLSGQEYMSIDNEEFEMKPIKLKCLKEKVYFFVP